jgi:catalase
LRPVGRMVLDRNPANYFAEVEQASFGTGVFVDGLDFSDKMLQGRKLSYSDTQRYRVGPNDLQLPINQAKRPVSTNQRDGQMTYVVDGTQSRANPHVNYEPNSLVGVREAVPVAEPHTPSVEGRLVREAIERTNPYQQAGERYRAIEAWERDDLIVNLVDALSQYRREIQDRLVDHFTRCDPDYGAQVARRIGIEVERMVAAPAGSD